MTANAAAPRRFRLASPATAVVLGAVILALIAATAALAALAGGKASAGGGSLIFAPVFGVLGFVVAWRKPGNRLGWLLLGAVGFLVLSGAAGAYAVAAYREHHAGLPLAWVAVLLQPGWAPAIALFGLTILLFPDGRLPSPRWRWALWAYLAVAALWIAGTVIISVWVIAGHHVQVDSGGNLLAIDHPVGWAAWWGAVQGLFFPVLGACWLASVAGQVVSYRRSSGDRRQQLKWLIGGSAIAAAGGLLGVPFSNNPDQGLRIAGSIGLAAVLALPLSMGVAILKYRLYDIDRILSRTVAYAIITGLLLGVYAGLVLLATQVLGFSSTWAVAGSTLAAAALFTPLRRRVQQAVDRRFNRARYDADLTVTIFAARLQDAVDLGTVHADLLAAVSASLQPAHLSVWVREHRP
ncbi:MAG: hypothetical protein QOG05_4450 [Streptosporangiaceae bacterium]|nr:hypothetical protein [Streptosporangiaceae bacterium]